MSTSNASDALTTFDIVTRFVLPPILGGGAGFMTVFLNWQVEKHRDKRAARRELIASWRLEVFKDWPEGGVSALGGGQSDYWAKRPEFRSLKQHLSPELRRKMDSSTVTVVVNQPDAVGDMLAAEIDRIERAWGLI
jgi:hypothetical protein